MRSLAARKLSLLRGATPGAEASGPSCVRGAPYHEDECDHGKLEGESCLYRPNKVLNFFPLRGAIRALARSLYQGRNLGQDGLAALLRTRLKIVYPSEIDAVWNGIDLED